MTFSSYKLAVVSLVLSIVSFLVMPAMVWVNYTIIEYESTTLEHVEASFLTFPVIYFAAVAGSLFLCVVAVSKGPRTRKIVALSGLSALLAATSLLLFFGYFVSVLSAFFGETS